MAMTTEKNAVFESPEARIVLHDVGWSDYEKMLQVAGNRRMLVTYSEGTMELRIPSQRHEQVSQLLGLFIPSLAGELEVDYEPLGMTTWKRPDVERGLEADQCYYIRNEAIVRERDVLDLEVDPPPDLAVEVDITSSSLDRLEIYAELRIPEVWRHDGRKLTMYRLQPDGAYEECNSSRSFPDLRPADLERFIELGKTQPKRQWIRAIRDWVRGEFIPRRDEQQASQN
jgi:Uma2 family endonuclease